MDERDPYRIADVIQPWFEPPDDYAFDDIDEWPGERIIAKGKADETRNRARQYLAMNGAAVWKRVERSMEAAEQQAEFPAGSIVAAVTACELTIRFLLLRPMIAALVFNTRLSMRLVRERTMQPERDRKMLPHVASAWGLQLEDLRLPNGQPLWDTLQLLIEVRNNYVHRADPVVAEQAGGALDCAQELVTQVVRPLAERVGLAWPPSDWTHKGRTHDPVEASFDYMGS
jgi:hypothetical protein